MLRFSFSSTIMERSVATKIQVRNTESLMERFIEGCSVCPGVADSAHQRLVKRVSGHEKDAWVDSRTTQTHRRESPEPL